MQATTTNTTTASETDPLVASSSSKDGDRRDGAFGWKTVATFVGGLLLGSIIVFFGSTTRNAPSDSSAATTPTTTFHNKSGRKYSATQFISFSINTLGGMEEFGECEGRPIDEEDGLCYLGNPDDLEDDLNHRFGILEEVLLTLKEDALLELPEVDHSSHVLKIFMLPEFYLRGPQGAYSAKEFREDGLMADLADRVRDLVADDAFENYLFVLGTVIMADSDSSNWVNMTTQEIDKGDVLYFNYAPVYRGGSMHAEERYVIPKNYISTADFLNRNIGLPDPRQSHLVKYDSFDAETMSYMMEERHAKIVTDGILDIDGVRIGIEICLDHRLGVLWKHLQETSGKINPTTGKIQVDPQSLVDVHLITSAGMAIERGPTPLRPNGVVYLTDGGASSAACRRVDRGDYDPSAVCRDRHNDGPTGLRHVPMGGEGYSSYMELATCLNPDEAPWKPMMKGYYSEHATQGCAYTLKIHGIDVFDEEKYDSYPPSIEIYPTVELPK